MGKFPAPAVKSPGITVLHAASPAVILHDLLRDHAWHTPDAPSLVSPDGSALGYGRLFERIEGLRLELAELGFGEGDRLALVMQDGPELALAFLAISGQATAAPLNPGQAQEAMASYVSDTGARALLASGPTLGLAAEVGRKLGLPILELVPDPGEVGSFVLRGDPLGPPRPLSQPKPDSIAYLLPTAGTTGRPKVVPVRHSMVMASSKAMWSWLDLKPADRCLNVMPLFHSHGLLNGLIWPLSAGGSTVCPPKFQADAFFAWFEATRPTWFTAVPTIHRAVVNSAASHYPALSRSRLRFVRSSSAALPPDLLREIGELFGAPVIETYGLTETGPLVTSPLGPGRQKPGRAGIPSGPEVLVTDPEGRPLPSGEIGEIVARGPTIMAGYERNEEANASAFRAGWFRTGDLGRFDAEGYLTVAGRVKEQINRGGEKIAPLEVDNALMSHPAVQDAACFAMPHPTLGEEIGAAVVFRAGQDATPEALQRHAAARLDAFKVPRLIRAVDVLPKSAAGKTERGKIADMLGLGRSPADSQKEAKGQFGRTPLEAALLGLWQAALHRQTIGPDDDFFLLGGDSLSAAALVSAVNEVFGTDLPPEAPFSGAGTVSAMLAMVAAARVNPKRDAYIDSDDAGDGPIPATPTQRSMWVVSTTFRGEPVFNIASALRFRGPLDRHALERAVAALAGRHDALRTTLHNSGGKLQQIVRADTELAPEDLIEVRPGDAAEAAAQVAQRPFDLDGRATGSREPAAGGGYRACARVDPPSHDRRRLVEGCAAARSRRALRGRGDGPSRPARLTRDAMERVRAQAGTPCGHGRLRRWRRHGRCEAGGMAAHATAGKP